MRFTNKVLIATGAGSGIAAATARLFTAQGGRVAIMDLDASRALAVASECEGSIGLACDVSDEKSVQNAVAEACARLGRIDCVFNAAGYVVHGPIDACSVEQWNRMLAVHVTGTFLICKAALPALRAAGGGAIVNTSSTAALSGRKNVGAYSAAKGAIHAFSRQLAVELGDDKIRVNAIAPGWVRTGLTEPLLTQRGGGDYAKAAAVTALDTVQKRIAEPEEIAAPVCFLLSDEASFITGTLLVPDGGMTAI